MPSLDCLHCGGSGYAQDAAGEDMICPVCDGTGVVFVDEDVGDVETEGWAGGA